MIEVTYGLNDPVQALSRQVWRFNVLHRMGRDEIILRLDYYSQETRPTKRHKWRSDYQTTYSGFDKRNGKLKREEVEVPSFIAEKAKLLLIERISMEGDNGA